MILARGKTEEGKELFILGLSARNISKLLDGQPMHIKREVHGEGVPEGWEIVIVAGVDEQSLAKIFVDAGLIDPEQIHRDPKLDSTL